MKGIKLLLAVCLAPLAFGGAMADNNTDAARAAVRRTPNNTVTAQRQKSSAPQPKESVSAAQSASRATNLSIKSGTTPRGDTNTAQPATNTRSQSVTPRQSTTTPARTRTTGTAIQSRTTTQSRSAATRATATTPRVANTARTASARAALSRGTTKTIARAAGTDSTSSARTEIMSNNAKTCREVYYNCMDEFCANKDATLKRCACSGRMHEFDSVKKNLANIEDKMLAFNQRLLTVNMDKEDAEALYKATEGELAFNQKDTSQSKKILDEIAKKLNTSFNDSNFDRNLSPISLSLDMDAAFDSIDSMQGAAATSKSGTELYTAALPVCREMAREVCTDDDLTIAESGYQMVIAQDCNTVAKAYQAQTDQARERVREGGALLDMSRLDIYQKRNSDDTLTCKKKMLDMLTDASVCGSALGKCLDVSGRYIDPSTGEAFLTTDLIQINNLITRPTDNQTWTSAPGNNVFVSYLNSKKKFLAPAMENCQDIADTVWDAFLDDALSQIKLAQENKLEDMRQSCTTLTTKCLSDTAKTLADFDARALSIFGVKADKTVKAMCADVTNACTALIQNQGDTKSEADAGNDWVGGMTEIANANTYETILSTCREVGRACIIQVCSSISGNFGLCESIQSSVNRKSIINRTACWNEVVQCVKDAGIDKIDEIMEQLDKGVAKSKLESVTRPTERPFNPSRPLDPLNPDTPVKPISPIGPDTPLTPVRTAMARTRIARAGIDTSGTINQGPITVPDESQQTSFLQITGNDFYDETYNTPSAERAATKPENNKLFVAKLTNEVACTASDITNDSNNVTCLYDMCGECNFEAGTTPTAAQKSNCNACRIAEQIWGNCEAAPATPLTGEGMHNKILQPKENKTTLLWWFAQNTGTSNQSDSCRDTSCPAGYTATYNKQGVWTCRTSGFDITHETCTDGIIYNITDTPVIQNCCPAKNRDGFEHCPNSNTIQDVDVNNATFRDSGVTSVPEIYYLPDDYTVVTTWSLENARDGYPAGNYALICAGANSTDGTGTANAAYPSGQTITCNGTFVALNLDNGLYFTPGAPGAETNIVEKSDQSGTKCYYSLTTAGWKKTDGTNCDITPKRWRINIDY